jgi:hypothetical protein
LVLRQTLGVPPDAPLLEFIGAAERHPVFELSMHPDRTPHSFGHVDTTRVKETTT